MRVAKSLNIHITELPRLESKLIINQIINKYAQGKRAGSLWENFTNEVGIDNKNAWKWIRNFVDNNETIMFFNPEEESAVLKFLNGKDLIAEINQEHNHLEIELYPSKKITFDYQEFLNILENAKRKLISA